MRKIYMVRYNTFMTGLRQVTHVSVRGEYGISVRIPAWDMEKILTAACSDTQAVVLDTTSDSDVLRGIRARTRDDVRRWALEHDVAFAPDE